MKNFILLVSLSISVVSFAQLPGKLKDKIKTVDNAVDNKIENDKAIELKNKALEKAKKSAENRVKKNYDTFKKDYDAADFNYAISFSDNAGLFETKEKADKHKAIAIEGFEAAKGVKNIKENESPDLDVNLDEKARDLNMTGEMLFASGKYRSAEYSFRQSMAIYKKQNKAESLECALPASNLALLYHTTGRYTKADSLAELALAIREKQKRGGEEHGASINNKAVLYKDMGRYNESEKLIAEAIAVSAEVPGKNSIQYALLLNNQAMLYQAVGRNEEAEKISKECLEIAKTSLKESSSNYVKLTINLAHLYQGMGKYDNAEQVYLEAIKMKERKLGKSHPDYAHLKRGLATLYMEMGKREKIESLLKEAAGIYKNKLGEEHPSYASTISDLGNFYRVSNRLNDAEPLLVKALAVRKKVLGENHPDYINSLEDYAVFQWQKNNIKEAAENYKKVIAATLGYIDAYFAPMSESEKSKFWAKMAPRLNRFNSFCVVAGKAFPDMIALMYNTQISTKALLLGSTNKVRQQIMASGNDVIIKKYTSWLDQKENLARLYTLSKEELIEENINLDSLENIVNKMEKELSAESEIFNKEFNKQQVSFKELASSLKPDEAIVEIVQFRNFNQVFVDSVYYAVLVIDKTTVNEPKFAVLKNGNDLETTYIKEYRSGIKKLIDSENTYSQFWSEIDKLTNGKKTLYVSPDGVYNQISLNTIKEPSGKYLIDTKNIVLVGNSKDVLKVKAAVGKKANVKKTASMYGYPKYGDAGKISELPGTKKEVENIDKILKSNGYKTKTFFELNASEENVKSTSSEILHIATHGFFLPAINNPDAEKVLGIETSKAKENPLHRSGILLAGAENVFMGNSDRSTSNNGVLTAYEAMNMSLDNTELVVLSACETGLGDVKVGEGVYGLQRSFLVAGAKSVIMSLWTVSDEATVDLMTNFYKNFAVSGNKQDAFLKAQKQLKLKYPQPNYWGAFVLMGN